MTRYRLNRGIHQEGGKTYFAGDPKRNIIETDKDLLKHNRPGHPPRYELVEQVRPISEAQGKDDLDSMTISELRELAEREEIDLGDLTKKADLIEFIRDSLARV